MGTEPDCPDETWLNGAVCQPWTQCQPGELVTHYGSSRRDRVCAPCPPSSYSSTENASSCQYNGCNLPEIAVTTGSSTKPATCAPRPGHFPVGSGDSHLIGLASRGTRVYAALVSPTEATFHGLEGEVVLEPLSHSLTEGQEPDAFAMAPNGTFYLTGRDSLSPGRIWIDAISSDASSATQIDISTTSQYAIPGLLSTPTHLIHWTNEYDGSVYETVFRAMSHSLAVAGEARISEAHFFHLAASSIDRIFFSFWNETGTLHRLLDFTPPVEDIPLPESFFPRISAATATGGAYAVGGRSTEVHTVDVYQVDSDGSVTEHFEHRFEHAVPMPMAAALDPGRALYILCQMQPESGVPSAFDRERHSLLRFDLVTGQSTDQSLGGGPYDWIRFLTVTSDGFVYIAGNAASSHFVRKVD